MMRSFGLFPLAFLGLSLSVPRAAQEGTLGSVRYTLNTSETLNLTQNSELLSISGETAEFLAPLNSLAELDRLAFLSHAATSLCGSLDYYPVGYTLADSVTHTPSYLSPEYKFSSLATLIQSADLNQMNQTLTTLTSLPSRYHRHATGQNAGGSVKQIWTSKLAAGSAWTLQEASHTITPQKSVIASLPGDSSETLVLGAHLDSINSKDGADAISPGADDDGSGVAILTEILRIIEANGLRFHRTIEFHAYAAEEIGLIGSRDLARQYRAAGKNIAGMLQFDMAYYSKAADLGTLYFLEDYTSLDLTRNTIRLTKNYLGDVYRRGFLPKGSASDHKAWHEQGYPTLFPFENPTADNPSIHTADDSMNQFDDGVRMKRMVQLGLLFLAYHGGLKTLDAETAAEQERVRSTAVAKDLFLNVRGASGSYGLEASTAQTAAYAEYCRIEAANDFRCIGPRLKLTEKGTSGNRKIFVAKASWRAGERYRVEIFDAADALIARRHIELE